MSLGKFVFTQPRPAEDRTDPVLTPEVVLDELLSHTNYRKADSIDQSHQPKVLNQPFSEPIAVS